MWERNIEIQIYNLFAEIYLFLDNIDTVKKNLLEDNYDFVQLSEKKTRNSLLFLVFIND